MTGNVPIFEWSPDVGVDEDEFPDEEDESEIMEEDGQGGEVIAADTAIENVVSESDESISGDDDVDDVGSIVNPNEEDLEVEEIGDIVEDEEEPSDEDEGLTDEANAEAQIEEEENQHEESVDDDSIDESASMHSSKYFFNENNILSDEGSIYEEEDIALEQEFPSSEV
jgi:hypothetical protein